MLVTEDQQQQQDRNKMKKCRGNRKLQRFRAKLRRQGLDADTITTLVNNSYHDNSHSLNNADELMVPNVDIQALVPSSQDQV